MKKLVLSLFALSNLIIFAAGETPQQNLDSASVTVNISATILEQTQLEILEGDGTALSNGQTALTFKDIGKSTVTGDQTSSKTMQIQRRGGNDKLLFNSTQNTINAAISNGNTLTLTNSSSSTSLLGTLAASVATPNETGTTADLTITATLTKESIDGAVAGSYTGSKVIVVTVTGS
jgi:hypothetical protein